MREIQVEHAVRTTVIGTENKVHLIYLICQQVQVNATYITASEDSFNHKLVINKLSLV